MGPADRKRWHRCYRSSRRRWIGDWNGFGPDLVAHCANYASVGCATVYYSNNSFGSSVLCQEMMASGISNLIF